MAALSENRWLAGVQLFTGAGIGAGLCSCLFFIARVSGWTTARKELWIELAFLILFLFFFFRARSLKNRPSSNPAPEPSPEIFVRGAVFLCFFFLLANAILAFVLLSKNNPHGNWDAWAIWNMHARFLYRGGASWRVLFSPELAYSHPDYPLLLPELVAREPNPAGTYR